MKQYYLQSGNYRDIVVAENPLSAIIKSLQDESKATPNEILHDGIIINENDFDLLNLNTKMMPLNERFYVGGMIEVFDLLCINPVEWCPIPSYFYDIHLKETNLHNTI